MTEAAKLAGVHRCTVHEWLRSDIGFRAQLSSRQRELRSALGVRLMKLCEKATNVVEKALEDGFSLKSIATKITESKPFVKRRAQEDSP